MYHLRFKGNHYEIGYRFGAGLAQKHRFLLDNVPFPITKERQEYAQACLPLYRQFFPEILAEIYGLAEGQQCEVQALQALLFSMYALPPASCCSCFATANGEHILLGRNSDFLTALEKYNMNVIYNFTNASYSFTGNTTAFLEMEDGINAHGLAIGLTSVYPVTLQPGFNAGLLLRFLLEKCRNTQEALRKLAQIPIGSAQTLTIADAAGDIAVIECNSAACKVIRPTTEQPFVCAANIFCAPEMQPWQKIGIDNWQAEDRYATMVRTLQHGGQQLNVQSAQDLLSGKHGFICQYNRKTGKDTVWSVIYDLGRRAIYRAEGNPARCKFRQDLRFKFN